MSTQDRRLAIIDADSILYSTASTAEMCAKGQGMDGEDLWFPVRSAEECYREVRVKIEERLEVIEAEDALIILSDKSNFRYGVLPTYKSNRLRVRRPPMLVHLREALMELKPYPVITVAGLEADDVCGITSTSMQVALHKGRSDKVPVVSSDDKDLRSVPGILHTPRLGTVAEIPLPEADRAHLYQSLVGDVVDGYTGLPRVGPVSANRILDAAGADTVLEMYRAVEAAYVARGHSQADCLTQCRVARILRNTDWNPKERSVRLWGPATEENPRG